MKRQDKMKVRKTRLQKNFQQTVLKLYRKKNVDEITINEVCEKLDVPRSSFYYHYKTIRDVVNEIEDDFFRANKKALASVMMTGIEKTDYVNVLNAVLPVVKSNETVVKTLRFDSSFLMQWAHLLSASFSKEPGHRENVIAFLTVFGIGDYLNHGVSLNMFDPDAAYEVCSKVVKIKMDLYSSLSKQ